MPDLIWYIVCFSFLGIKKEKFVGSLNVLDEELRKELGCYLKELRKQAGLSQKDVSQSFAWTTAQFVSNWERGRMTPSRGVLRELIKMYNADEFRFIDRVKQIMTSDLERSLTGVGISGPQL
jgi:transcriptional regulator with XRE-family HTH domain